MIDSQNADSKFSEIIRERDPICRRCHWRPSTDCSHYWERQHSATRFDERNADGLCRECHTLWEGRKNGYREYKIKQLGKKVYAELERLHNTIMQREDAVSSFVEKYNLNTQ